MIRQGGDIIIVGGGVVGLALAVALGRQHMPVALIEARSPQTDWPPESVDRRVYAISRASERLFAGLDVWDGIREYGVSPFRDMRVWDAGGGGEIHFDAAELGQPCLGHIIEERVIIKALFQALASLPSVQLFSPATVTAFEATDSDQAVTLDSGTTLRAALLIGADGVDSRVRDHAHIHARASSYGQQALVAVVETEKPHRETAWQRFMPSGPLAFLPLRDGRSSIVWSATSQVAESLARLDDRAFCARLGEASGHRLGEIVASGERVLFPLRRQHAAHYVKPGIALVGDAAHVIHPLAGQGVNLGLADVQALVSVLHDAVEHGRSPGSYSVLRRYERARKGGNLVMMTAMDGFKFLFGSTVPALQWARNRGLNVVDAASPLKNQIARVAMGL